MLTTVHPKLPMRDKAATRAYYVNQLGFEDIGQADYPDYLMVSKDQVELHFFRHSDLDPAVNDGQVYIRVNGIEEWYGQLQQNGVSIHPNDPLQVKPWRQKEFSLLDPDNNLLTFGQSV